ncbi:hypothetical protein AVEN_131420-1 [Araneus ventricosus]|uniref:Uncharacterized protein n=1 Tax=Araneus ventricosus TaxID=182803 RepID=A0A4Y2JAN1_ARAVE|nr:hypothetical protein AVEN_131420-1 [Araneus ventricosus]
MPLLTAHHQLQRLFWAHELTGWTLDDWKNIGSSDKSRFLLLRADGRVRMRLIPHEAKDANCQQDNMQAGGGSIIVCDVLHGRDWVLWSK